MELSKMYGTVRLRLIDLAGDLGDGEAATPVAALPGWTVRDTYAHLAGICADALDGTLTGPPTDEWTAAQVEARRDRSLAEICDEWAQRAPQLEAALTAMGDAAPAPLAVDAWAHEHDIRGAVRRPGDRDDDTTAWTVQRLVGALRQRFAEAGLPSIRVVGDHRDWMVGRAAPVATLTASDYELSRALIGRRSRSQLARLGWDGDPEPFLDHLSVFAPPTDDLVD